MKWNSSNQTSFHFVWLEYNEGNQYVWLDTFPKEINDLWRLLWANKWNEILPIKLHFVLAGIQWGESISCQGEMKFGSEM